MTDSFLATNFSRNSLAARPCPVRSETDIFMALSILETAHQRNRNPSHPRPNARSGEQPHLNCFMLNGEEKRRFAYFDCFAGINSNHHRGAGAVLLIYSWHREFLRLPAARPLQGIVHNFLLRQSTFPNRPQTSPNYTRRVNYSEQWSARF